MQGHRNTTATVRAVLKVAEAVGVPPERLLELAGISTETAFDPDGEVSLETMKTFWEHAYRETGNPYLAIDAGVLAVHGSYKTIDYLLLTATTPGEGLTRFVEHFRLINTWLNFTIHHDAAGYHLTLASKIGPVPFPAVEITFAVVTERFRRMLGSRMDPSKHPELARQLVSMRDEVFKRLKEKGLSSLVNRFNPPRKQKAEE